MPPTFPAFVALGESRYGSMLYPKADQYVGRSIMEYGEFSAGELALFQQLIQPGAVVVDVGANIGAHTVPLAQWVGLDGFVIAFEPQRILHQILCANLALNSIPNVVTQAMALADVPGQGTLPVLDYGMDFNFGAVALDLATVGETVRIATLDQFQLPRVDFIKVDVEGFEQKVLEGAACLLDRCKPALYVENDRRENSPELIRFLQAMGYRLWWHLTPLFNPDNFRGNPVNHFPGLVSANLVAVIGAAPAALAGLREVRDAQDWWC